MLTTYNNNNSSNRNISYFIIMIITIIIIIKYSHYSDNYIAEIITVYWDIFELYFCKFRVSVQIRNMSRNEWTRISIQSNFPSILLN